MRPLRLALLCALVCLAAPAVLAQGQTRAEPVTGTGIVTIGNVPTNARVEVHLGPGAIFPVIGSMGYGTRVRVGACIGGGSARWCQVEAADGSAEGFVRGRFLVEGSDRPSAGPGREPDYWVVRGLPRGERLNVRREPSPRAVALATLGEGEVVQNLGCRDTSAGRWCRIRSIIGMDVTGWVSARYLGPSRGPVEIQPPLRPGPGGGVDPHGPDFYVVRGLSAGDRLNIRAEPSARAAILGTLDPGARVRNLGCRQSGQTRWCRIETTGGVRVTGWVNGRFLREG